MLRTRAIEVSLWEAVLPEELLRLPEELARVDALLDDPVFFAPFVPFFDPRIGRPSTPMETYLRLMFLKFRYRLGYESLCREVADSITWRRFCRIPLDGPVPHPTTLMKLTTRCGPTAVDGLNEALLAKAAEAKLLRTNRVRADTTVVPANVAYPTDSGLLAKAVRRIAATGVSGSRPPAARSAPRCGTGPGRPGRGRTDRARSCGPARRRAATRPRPGCSGSPASWPTWPRPPPRTRETAAGQRPPGAAPGARRRPPSWPRPAIDDAAAGRRRGRLARAVNDLTELLDATRQIVAQTRQRIGRDHPGRGDPAGQPARPRRPPDRQGPARASRSSSATRPRSSTTTTAIVLDHNVEPGNPADAPQLAPAIERVINRTGRTPRTVTADRGYGEASVDDDLHDLGVRNVVIPRKGRPGKARQADEHRRAFRRTVKWRTGCEGRISTLKRSYGWDRTRIDGTEGARIWTGHGVLAHNLIKIAALAA